MKFIVVAERSVNTFNQKVQFYLNNGYVLKGKLFVTENIVNGAKVQYYNQALVKNEDKKSEKK